MRPVALVLQGQVPETALSTRSDTFRPRPDVGTAISRVARIEDNEARIIDPAIGVFESTMIDLLQPLPGVVLCQIETSGRRQNLAATKMVIKKEAEPDNRPRPQTAVVRENEPQRPNDVGRRC